MKNFILFFIATIGFSLWAKPPAKNSGPPTKLIEVKDLRWGTFHIKLTYEGEPVQQPIRIDVSVLCKDQRSNPNSIIPKLEMQPAEDNVCAFDNYFYDKESRVLTLEVTTTSEDSAKCDQHFKQPYDLKEICAPWKP